MKYDLTATEHVRLSQFLREKMRASMLDSAHFDANLPGWYKHVEKIHARMVAKPDKLQLSLSAWEVEHLASVRGIDVEFPELSGFLNEEREALIDAGKLPAWLRNP